MNKSYVTVGAFIIVSVLLIGFTYAYTAGPIYANRARQAAGALAVIMPSAAYTTYESLSVSSLTRAERAYNEHGNFIGHAITASPVGYAGAIDMMTVFDPYGNIVGVQIIRHTETRGIGSLIEGYGFINQFVGKSGIIFNTEIDAIVGATISVNAVLQGINNASVYLGFGAAGQMPPMPIVPPDEPQISDLIPGTRFTDFVHVDDFTVDWLALAYDQHGVFLGYVYFASPRGFGGSIEMAVVLDLDGVIQNVVVISHRETWNFGGAALNDPNFLLQFNGHSGEIERQDIDMISMATISIDSVLRGINDIKHHHGRFVHDFRPHDGGLVIFISQ